MYKPLIVGLDPGASVGIAIFDFRGNIISTSTKRYAGKNEIIKYISQFGKPILVASDVNPMPAVVKSIASMTSSKMFSPEKSLTIRQKIKLIGKFRRELKGTHVKDAFAAGYKAFKAYRSLLQKVELDLSSRHMDSLYENVVNSLITKHAYNIKEAIKLASS